MMKSLREQLHDIEQYSYQTAVRMVTMVRMNYENVLARKEKEFDQRLKSADKHNRGRYRRRLLKRRL